jgi:outer membrane receptor protein involved in Fe transport
MVSWGVETNAGTLRAALFTTVGTLSLILGGQAFAQATAPLPAAAAEQQVAATPDVPDQAAADQDITVTGSRIVRDGYSAPTPVTVLGAADIAAQAPANISDFVNQLPSIAGSGTSGTSSGALSNGAAGVNSISLRGLGAGRTLVLLDGQRSVASTVGGVVDINTFPQDLVERVEVVTGGASAHRRNMAPTRSAVSSISSSTRSSKASGCPPIRAFRPMAMATITASARLRACRCSTTNCTSC